jgi:CO/xanthine dehydrogenase FAD-binding subunit
MRPVFLPATVEALWPILESEPAARVFGGGTDLLVRLRQGLVDPPCLVGLERIEALREVRDEGPEVFIGAGATHAALLGHSVIAGHFPVLTKALGVLGAPAVRNMGTLGGNVCTASPAADTLPPLYALKAEVVLRSRSAERRMKLSEFITGPGLTRLGPAEILWGIRFRKIPAWTIHHFEKVGRRKALAIAVVSLAALIRLSAENRIEEARFAWGSVGPTVVVSPEVEEALLGKPLSRETLERTLPLVACAVRPIDDVRAGAAYRRLVAGNLLLRLLETAQPGPSCGACHGGPPVGGTR